MCVCVFVCGYVFANAQVACLYILFASKLSKSTTLPLCVCVRSYCTVVVPHIRSKYSANSTHLTNFDSFSRSLTYQHKNHLLDAKVISPSPYNSPTEICIVCERRAAHRKRHTYSTCVLCERAHSLEFSLRMPLNCSFPLTCFFFSASREIARCRATSVYL